MRNFDFYSKATWQEVKPKIRTFIEQFQQQQEIQIQNIEQFYYNLEYDHSFIQWIFPNFYSSRFNSNCYKLTLIERDQIIKSQTILNRYYQNYIMILPFFGIELKQVINMDIQNYNSNRVINQLQLLQQQFQQTKETNNSKSELVLIDKSQFELCCLKNTHNLLRLKRILASLSVLKHRKEAIQLCSFKKKELTNLDKIKIYEEYFSEFDRYYEEISDKETNRDLNRKFRKFNSYKFCYVDKDLIEKKDISLIQ